ncbi:MAG: hypothetical protein CL605_02525 [Altibacter sp.]|uniref:hypothetical protein n=1 Tax=Altibacter sp. TaxID=2024823 RepID=UPI000C8BB3F4|nr:hypothetical protein [Altibacter sp.]MAP53757.1 hypothetical protein [Altibacter sp.]|tara:strand:+ start:25050 stop:25670 length:621 start_codon:yes stop_codon:yes gene_type:complete
MIKSLTNQMGIKGHLTIHKIVEGEEEVVYDEDNVIVSGFGWALSHLYGKLGSNTITDYQIDRVQLGVSGYAGLQVSSTNSLSGALSSTTEYLGQSTDSNLNVVSGFRWENDSVVTTPQIYAKIPFSKVTRIDDRTVRYTIFIDEDSCNNLSRPGVPESALNEIGLFIKNPKADNIETSILTAYRYFSNIRKTSDFALVFRWTISFG